MSSPIGIVDYLVLHIKVDSVIGTDGLYVYRDAPNYENELTMVSNIYISYYCRAGACMAGKDIL